MSIRLAINGFGRIGRSVFRLAYEKFPDIEVVAVNDLVSPDSLAYLLKYDTVHGRWGKAVEVQGQNLLIDQKHSLQILNEREPDRLPWRDLSIDFVIESTGLFTHPQGAGLHLSAGAKGVIISAPAKGEVPTYVMGVNHHQYRPDKDRVVSNASCTTNCLAPIVKVLLKHFGIEEGLMTTVHAITATQPTQDSPSKKSFRSGRAASMNIIPSSTGAAKAVALCLPEVEGKLTGKAFRVPTLDVSVVDLTVRLTKATSYEMICEMMRMESQSNLKGILHYSEEELVSSDFVGDTHSAIFDKGAGIGLNPHFYKLVAWYDNEVGYACRLLDLMKYMAAQR